MESVGVVLPFNVRDDYSSNPLAGLIYTAEGQHPKKRMTARDIQQAWQQIFTLWADQNNYEI